MSAKVVVEHLSGPAPGAAVEITGAWFRADDLNEASNASPIAVPAAPSAFTYLAEPVAGSVTSQSVTVQGESFEVGDSIVLDGGQIAQEVVLITAVTSTTIQGIFRRSHTAGATMARVVASYGKTIRLRALTAPQKAISHIRLMRLTPFFTAGLLDQYRLVPEYAQGGTMPWPSSADAVHAAVGLAPIQIAAGPFPAAGVLATLELQWLFFAFRAGLTGETRYRFLYEES